jgi:hypothetical protein
VCQRPELHPDNLPALELFMASLTQIRVSMAGPIGLDYQGVQATAWGLGVEMSPDLFRKVQAAESAWLEALAEGKCLDPADCMPIRSLRYFLAKRILTEVFAELNPEEPKT